MKIVAGDNLNAAIKKVCGRSLRAGSVVILIQREFPDTTMDYLKALDKKGLYGDSLADHFFGPCEGKLDSFLTSISNG